MVKLEQLRETQLYELELLKKLREICDAEGLTYYLVGGTAIGAARHSGFIPWDDDVDVALMRPDYDKFIKVAKKYLEPGQEVLHYSLREDYRDCSMKLVNSNVTYKMKTDNSVVWQSIWIDIFPLDGTFRNSLRQMTHYYRVYFLRMLLAYYYLERIQYNLDRSKWKRILISIARYIPINKMINPDRTRKKIDRLLESVPIDEHGIIGNYLGAYGLREFIPFSVFGDGELKRFEDDSFMVPENLDTYLTEIYGDYMKLPPKEKQVPRHNVIEFRIKS